MHWFLDPITKHYFDFSGRVTRKTFWLFVLLACVINIIFSVLDHLISTAFDVPVIVYEFLFYVVLVVVIVCIYISVRSVSFQTKKNNMFGGLALVFVLYTQSLMTYPDLSTFYFMFILPPAIALTSRRLHDKGISGWWQLPGLLIPVLGWVVLFCFLSFKGDQAANKYGPSPYADSVPVPPAGDNAD